MYFVTFRAVTDAAQLAAQLVNAVGESADSQVLHSGLGTNCVTPSFAFNSSTPEGNLTDVAHSVHRYRSSSVAPNTLQLLEPAQA